MLKIIVDNCIRFDKNYLPKEMYSVFRENFTYSNPDFFKNKNLGFSTNGIPRYVRTYKVGQKQVKLARGEIGKFKRLLNEFDIDYKIVDNTLSIPLTKKFNYKLVKNGKELQLDEKQKHAVKQCLFFKQGIIHGVTASGKTEILLKLAAELGQWTLVLVHNQKLFTQWKERIAKAYSIPESEIGQVGYGSFKIKPITISTIQSCHKKYDKLVDKFGCVIHDETHHSPATTSYKSITEFPARYRFGASGTLKRKDGKQFLMYALFGNVIAKITDDYLLDLNRIHQVKLTVIPTGFDCREFDSEGDVIDYQYSYYLEKAINDEHRNNIIVNQVESEVKLGNYCLIFSDRIAHCHELRKQLKKRKIKAKFIIGGDEFKEEGQQAIKEINDGKLQVVIASAVGDEGLDIPRLNRGFITTRSAGNEARIKQQVGRIKRIAEGKKDAIMYYFWDQDMFSRDLGRIKRFFGKDNVKVLDVNGYINN